MVMNLSSIPDRFYKLIFFAAILILTTIFTLAAFFSIREKGWGSDAAAWAQAAGTIIAVAGSAWLARSENRQARRWRRQQGEEAAWSARFVIKQAQFDSQIVAAELTRENQALDLENILRWQQLASNVTLALQTMLARTDYLHPAIILSLCNAKILIDQLFLSLKRMENLYLHQETIAQELIDDAVNIHVNLAVLLDEYDARIEGLRQALDRGQDMLPLQEWKNKREK